MDEHARRQRDSWAANAAAWTRAVREGAIASRRQGTDAAMVAALRALRPRRVLDLGCGEGWLCRALSGLGIETVGVDAAPALVAAARAAGPSRFECLDYAALAAAPAALGRFDAIACNFALLDEELAPLLRGLQGLCEPAASLVIQTVHPWTACGEAPYAPGWRTEGFSGFGEGFAAPMPWYFRRIEDWLALLAETGWRLHALQEPQAPDGTRPLSLLLVARRAGAAD